MPTDKELMQQALDALESSRVFVTTREKIKHPEGTDWYDERIEALRAALAQPEPKPAAWITGGGKGELWWHQSVKFDDDGNLIGENPDDIPLYTAPPQREWKGLTDEEMFSLWVRCPAETEDRFAFARAIEAKLKEKNGG